MFRARSDGKGRTHYTTRDWTFSHLQLSSFLIAFGRSLFDDQYSMDNALLQRLASTGVTALVAFLAYSSQWLFTSIEPGHLRRGDAYIFNTLVACLLICYWRSCLTDPGRIAKNWQDSMSDDDAQAAQRRRWCRKCEMYKPPRAHHCKTCKRYGSSIGANGRRTCAPTTEYLLTCLQLCPEDGPPLRLDR